LGEVIYSGRIPFVTAALTESLLTALRKKPTGPDARPVCAESADASCWAKAASRLVVDSVREHVSPQQLAVGVSGGMEVLIWGWQFTVHLEFAAKSNRLFVIHGDDQVNAHNSFDRKAAVRDIIQAAEDTKASEDASGKHTEDLSRLANMADVLLRLQKRIIARSKDSKNGYIHAFSKEGGAQGNPLTNLIYPMSTNLTLKKVEASFKGTELWEQHALPLAVTEDDDEDNVLHDIVGLDTSTDSDSFIDSENQASQTPVNLNLPLLVRAFQDDAFMGGSQPDTNLRQPEHPVYSRGPSNAPRGAHY
jgi:hypothetical protein